MKKPIIYGICAAIVVVAIAVSLIFVFSGNNEATTDNTPTLDGTWVICANYSAEVPTFNENQFAVFEGDSMKMYKGDLETPYATSKYLVDNANNLILSDIDMEYVIDKKTDNCIRLYENASTFMVLVKCSTSELAVEKCTATDFAGDWNVIMKGSEINQGDSLSFDDSSFKYYRAASSTPAVTSAYTVAESKLSAPGAGLNLRCLKTTNGNIIMLEEGNTNAWEITKK